MDKSLKTPRTYVDASSFPSQKWNVFVALVAEELGPRLGPSKRPSESPRGQRIWVRDLIGFVQGQRGQTCLNIGWAQIVSCKRTKRCWFGVGWVFRPCRRTRLQTAIQPTTSKYLWQEKTSKSTNTGLRSAARLCLSHCSSVDSVLHLWEEGQRFKSHVS